LIRALDAVETNGAPLLARVNQRGLWQSAETGQWTAFGGISAMPSLHVAVAVLLAIVAWNCSWRIGLLATGYTVVIGIGSVVLGWHYAVDGYVGTALAACCWIAAGWMVPSMTWPLERARTAVATVRPIELPASRRRLTS
jgi:membrane-associated phospholipid phosphatase